MPSSATFKLLKFWGVKQLAASSAPDVESSQLAVTRTEPTGPEIEAKAEQLHELEQQVQRCEKCPLVARRTHVVFGEGDPAADVAFVGEAPGFEEDRQGRPFVGKAGQLLNDIITKGMGLKREDVYICNVLKCRPPGNRTPSPEETVSCSPYLFQQLQIIRPKVIIALGSPAVKTLLDTKKSITELRGRFYDYHTNGPLSGEEPIKLMPTFHPAYLLRNPAAKAKVWDDIKKVLAYLGLPIPTRKTQASPQADSGRADPRK